MQVSSTENSSCIWRDRVVPYERKNLCKAVAILYYERDDLDLLQDLCNTLRSKEMTQMIHYQPTAPDR